MVRMRSARGTRVGCRLTRGAVGVTGFAETDRRVEEESRHSAVDASGRVGVEESVGSVALGALVGSCA